MISLLDSQVWVKHVLAFFRYTLECWMMEDEVISFLTVTLLSLHFGTFGCIFWSWLLFNVLFCKATFGTLLSFFWKESLALLVGQVLSLGVPIKGYAGWTTPGCYIPQIYLSGIFCCRCYIGSIDRERERERK